MRFGDMITRKKYYELQSAGMLYVYYPDCTGNYEADEEREDILNARAPRIDTVGQNGNTGEHYDNPDGVPWESYADKVERYVSPPSDPVHQPSHYEVLDGVEAIDIIKATLSTAEFIGYCKGNILKYQLRSAKKNKEEDLKKADVYSGWLMEVINE